MYKQDLTLNNLQGLICHKTQQPIAPNLLFPLRKKKIIFHFKTFHKFQ